MEKAVVETGLFSLRRGGGALGPPVKAPLFLAFSCPGFAEKLDGHQDMSVSSEWKCFYERLWPVSHCIRCVSVNVRVSGSRVDACVSSVLTCGTYPGPLHGFSLVY